MTTYHKFRFILTVDFDYPIGLSAVRSDGHDLILTGGHLKNQPMLHDILANTLNSVNIWLIDGERKGVRRIQVDHWDFVVWEPLDLDATVAEVAMERIVLKNVRYDPSKCGDVSDKRALPKCVLESLKSDG